MNDKITEIKEALGKATPGPWKFKLSPHNEYGLYGAEDKILSFGGRSGYEEYRGQEAGMDDEEFIQRSWDTITYLLQLVDTQTKGTEALKEWYQDLQDVAKNNSRQKERAIRELTTIDKTLELAGIKVPGINA